MSLADELLADLEGDEDGDGFAEFEKEDEFPEDPDGLKTSSAPMEIGWYKFFSSQRFINVSFALFSLFCYLLSINYYKKNKKEVLNGVLLFDT